MKSPLLQANLVIEGLQFGRQISLTESLYTIGRHSSNSIVIRSRRLSRHHATLVRKYDPRTESDAFWLFDGDLQGNRSKEGIFVNNQKYLVRELHHGDVISFGQDFQARYSISSNQKHSHESKPLGAILQEADLICPSQLEVALRDQARNGNLRIGEILALRGWIKQETADFFAQQWSLLKNQPKQPIGQYLKQAALLNEAQIEDLLYEQQYKKLQFGSLAVHKGWLKRSTVEFFIESLSRNYNDLGDTTINLTNPMLHAQQLNQYNRFLAENEQQTYLDTVVEQGEQPSEDYSTLIEAIAFQDSQTLVYS